MGKMGGINGQIEELLSKASPCRCGRTNHLYLSGFVGFGSDWFVGCEYCEHKKNTPDYQYASTPEEALSLWNAMNADTTEGEG